MLSRLPVLFHRRYVLAAEVLDSARLTAHRQLRLVKGVWAGSIALGALSFTPQFSGPGPLLTWAAQGWPNLFGKVTALLSQPLSPGELAGGLALLLGLTVICANELRGLQQFIQDLDPLEPGSSVLDALQRLSRTTPATATYMQAAMEVRTLRMGDWRVARDILERPSF